MKIEEPSARIHAFITALTLSFLKLLLHTNNTNYYLSLTIYKTKVPTLHKNSIYSATTTPTELHISNNVDIGTTNSFEMINTLALVASFPICGAVASLMRFATFATTLAIVTPATGLSFRQCMSR